MTKLQLIQQELKAPKDMRNTFGGYNYRSCESILESLKPLLAKHECFLVLGDEIINVGGWNYVKATARICDTAGVGIEVTAFARESEIKKGMDAAQITGAASSYARKYALNGLFAIDDTKDPDATNRHEHEEQEKAIDKRIEQRESEATGMGNEAPWNPGEVIVLKGKETKGKKVKDLTIVQLAYFANEFEPKTDYDRNLRSACQFMLPKDE